MVGGARPTAARRTRTLPGGVKTLTRAGRLIAAEDQGGELNGREPMVDVAGDSENVRKT